MSKTREAVILASGARTTTQTMAPLTLAAADGAFREILYAEDRTVLEITVDLTAFATTASLTPSLQMFDIGKGDYVTVLTGAAITSNSTVIMKYGPMLPTVANLSAQGVIGNLWRVVMTHGNGNSHTYSVSCRLA